MGTSLPVDRVAVHYQRTKKASMPLWKVWRIVLDAGTAIKAVAADVALLIASVYAAIPLKSKYRNVFIEQN